MQNKSILVIAVIVSLIVGSGGTYLYISNQLNTLTKEKADILTQFASLTSEKTQLQNRVASLTEEKETLEAQVNTLSTDKRNLQEQLNSLNNDITDLDTRYDLLAGIIDEMHSTNWTSSIIYNITAGTEMTKVLILDRFGIVWEVVMDFTGTSFEVKYYYWYMEERYFVSSSSKSLVVQNDPDITYYGPQDHIYGTIKIDTSLDYRIANRIWFDYSTLTQFPEIRLNGRFSLDVEEY